MPFEDFENKVRQAAEQHHPNYDETAWPKMEKMLDTHLPLKKDGRRRIFLFLFLFLLGGGGFLLIKSPWQKQKSTATIERKITPAIHSENDNLKETAGNSPGSSLTAPVENSATLNPESKSNSDVQEEDLTSPIKNSAVNAQSNNEFVKGFGQRKSIDKKEVTSSSITNVQSLVVNPTADLKNKDPKIVTNKTISSKELDIPQSAVISKSTSSSPLALIDDKLADNVDKPAASALTNPIDPESKDVSTIAAPPTGKKQAKSKSNSFFISVSAGPEMNFVGTNKSGKTRMVSGAGLGFTFNKKWTLRTGFYQVNKLYSAAPEDYKTYGAINTTYLQNIDADCKIYEIPLSIAYNFFQTKKQNAFASLGMSSYLMKKESYEFVYKYPSGTTYSHEWLYKNENKHLFSVFTISAGYERKLNNRFALVAEPYFKIPMSGVGEGKVRLNSAGLLVSIKMSPFSPKEKNK